MVSSLLLYSLTNSSILQKSQFCSEKSHSVLSSHKAPCSWNMVNLFLFGCHVTERTYASTDCTGRVGETIKRKGGVSQACLGKSTSFILDIHNMVN